MNRKSSNAHAVNAFPRCQKHTRNGRCRLPVSDASSSFCATHSRPLQQHREAEDLCATLTAGLTEFKSAPPINEFLSRLLFLQARDRIPPRRASVMAYTCNLLLRTLPAIAREKGVDYDDQTRNSGPVVIWDIPGPDYDPQGPSDGAPK